MKVLLAALIACVWIADARAQGEAELNTGVILVAGRQLRDPNFAATVILVARYGEEGAVGLVLNRRSDTPIAKALDEWKEAQGHTDRVFEGGPVQAEAVLALVRSRGGAGDQIVGDVHLVAEKAVLLKHLAKGSGQDKFRIYLGYAGWGPEQLENEIELGAWHVFPGDANTIFDADPDTLWSRLIRKSETQIARVVYN